MATETTTTVRITCDHCGRAIGAGETWYQIAHSVASGVFDGVAAGLVNAESTVSQLCSADYAATAAPALAAIALEPVAVAAAVQ